MKEGSVPREEGWSSADENAVADGYAGTLDGRVKTTAMAISKMRPTAVYLPTVET